LGRQAKTAILHENVPQTLFLRYFNQWRSILVAKALAGFGDPALQYDNKDSILSADQSEQYPLCNTQSFWTNETEMAV